MKMRVKLSEFLNADDTDMGLIFLIECPYAIIDATAHPFQFCRDSTKRERPP